MRRDQILNIFNTNEDRIFAERIFDYIDQVNKKCEPKFTNFLDPYQITIGLKILNSQIDVKYSLSNLKENLEKDILAIYPEYYELDHIIFPITALKISIKSNFEKINHRDVLGALLNLGIKREKLGDIILNGDECYILVHNDIVQYVIVNLNKIKHCSINASICNLEDIKEKEINYKDIHTTVASLRLDCFCSTAFGLSRNIASNKIKSGDVKVNFNEITDIAYNICEKDMVSVKGKGRAILDSIFNNTKKGRININIKKII